MLAMLVLVASIYVWHALSQPTIILHIKYLDETTSETMILQSVILNVGKS
jgi:hypothetical protein